MDLFQQQQQQQHPQRPANYQQEYPSNNGAFHQPVPQITAYNPIAPQGWTGAPDSAKTEPVVQYTEQSPQQQATHDSIGFFSSFLWWWPELLAAAVAIISLLAIAFVARHYRGQGIQTVDLPSGLGLNGLIALLSTIARAALLIPVAATLSQEAWLWFSDLRRRSAQLQDLTVSDDASRGAWGSVLLFGHFRRSWLAHMAAMVTVISLVFGTFTQQLITIRTFPVNDPVLNPGNVAWTDSWDNFTGRASEGNLDPPLQFKAAAYSAALSASSADTQEFCATGNCSWPITPSLAICGGCVDTTFTLNCDESVCNYTTASGAVASLSNFKSLSSQGVGFRVVKSKGFHYQSAQLDQLHLSNFEAVGARANIYSTDFKNNDSIVAQECALWMCIQSFETWTVSSNQTTAVRETFAKINPFNSTSARFISNVSFTPLQDSMNPHPDASYNVYNPAIIALQTFFAGFFNGTVTLNQG